MPAPKNVLKQAMAEGRLLRGLWLALGSEPVTEIAGRAGFDWCLVDGEHAPFDPAMIRRQLITLENTGTPAVVRAPGNQDWILKQVLDVGAQTIMVPMVNSAEEARAAVRACLYPPEGIRGDGGYTMRASGYGAVPGYASSANAEICVIVQAETRAALDNLAEIAAVEGVDCVLFGPADLAADLGYRDNPTAPEFWEEIKRGIGVIRAAGKAAGIFAPPDRNAEMVAAGVTFLSLGADAALMTATLGALARSET
ncbi:MULTISPECIES: HpcH/HpaI aldolase family protein [Roseicyclus]|uniref:2-keto-3-deoxy-L-rhamnonate aldolase n=1 Tax=Roseicyclus marinus TaxID=2161673 RepID=A0AA48HJQ3_9RHOB|nr:2-keto-3-deoxy-L-rhamnonate aldolase [Roseicyclus marinus]